MFFITKKLFFFLDFGIKRVLVRTLMMGLSVIMAESIPKFGLILDLVGGSAVTYSSVVFPGLFYLYLSAAEKKANEKKAQRKISTIKNSDIIIKYNNGLMSPKKYYNDDENEPRITFAE